MSYQFSFLIATTFLLIVWLILFFIKKTSRKEMLILSLISGFVAPFIEFIHLRDWWNPLMITHTPVGIEDFLYGFTIAGISIAIYPLLFNKEFKEKESKNKETLSLTTIGFGLFIAFSLIFNSLIGFWIASIFLTTTILILRKDLIKISFISGLFVMLICIPMYLLVEKITPGWIIHTWNLSNFSNIFVFKIPLEELIWHFLAGTNASIIYKFWKGSKEIPNLHKNQQQKVTKT